MYVTRLVAIYPCRQSVSPRLFITSYSMFLCITDLFLEFSRWTAYSWSLLSLNWYFYFRRRVFVCLYYGLVILLFLQCLFACLHYGLMDKGFRLCCFSVLPFCSFKLTSPYLYVEKDISKQ